MSVSTLTVVRPMDITSAMLVSSNVPETDYAEWAAGTTYAAGDRAILASEHKVYQSAIAGNVGKNPAADRTAWREVGATNRWKAFDKSISSQVAQATAISYRIKPGQAITALGVLNITAATAVRVRVIDPVYGTVYDKTASTASVPVAAGWWAWFFGERRAPTQVLLQDLPSLPTADLLVDITGAANLAVGVILLGQRRQFSMGVKMGARVGLQDYSRKERNEWGDTVLVQRAYAKRATVSMLLDNRELDNAYTLLVDLRATPCLWVISDNYSSLSLFGFFSNFEITISYARYSDVSIELESLT